MKNLMYLLSILLICLLACQDETAEKLDTDADGNSTLNIHFGSFGGLCGFSDSMSIFMNLDLTYEHSEFCTDTEYNNSKTITQREYNELFESFSLSTFSNMTNNSCARCVDGLDTFLHIEGDDFSHRIVYDQDDEVADISELISKLNEERESLKLE